MVKTLIAIIVTSFLLVGCGLFNSNKTTLTDPVEYTGSNIEEVKNKVPLASDWVYIYRDYGVYNKRPIERGYGIRGMFCHGHGCKFQESVKFTPAWLQENIAGIMSRSSDASEERENLKKAYAVYEQEVAKIHPVVKNDKKGLTFSGGKGQLDCTDEAINVHTFLYVLRHYGLLEYHKIMSPKAKSGVPIFGKWPHYAARIQDLMNNQVYAIDSTYVEYGEEPQIMTWEKFYN